MQVAMYYSNIDVRLEEMPIPQIRDDELLIQVVASGICGSDVMEWYRRDKVPLVLGHEVAGEVISIGNGVEKFKIGDRVASTHHVPCNTCHYCLNDHHTACMTLQKGTHFDPGGFAEYVRVPAMNVDRGTFHIPENVSYEDASFMEPLACVIRGQRNARFKPGLSVLIIGSGISGLLHISLARAMGAGLVIAADTIPQRLEKAKEMGADLVLYADENMIESLRKTNSGRLADIVIICHGEFIPYATKAVEKGGTILFFASAPEGATIPNTVNELFWRTEVTLTSSYAGSPADCSLALALIKSGNISVGKLITHRIRLADTCKGFQAVADPIKHKSIKVIVEPQA
ncbi:MAG: alcohol dehydrogenase catalytic domain-containing protein [Spirochaetota bacterium]|nr:alcohol dehydrogenase catalytic domain-containing protein [Spirochaetota bacterium]